MILFIVPKKMAVISLLAFAGVAMLSDSINDLGSSLKLSLGQGQLDLLDNSKAVDINADDLQMSAASRKLSRGASSSSAGPLSVAKTNGRLVMATMPREITGQDENNIKYVKYHLMCIAEVAKKADVHIVIYTSDEDLANYVEQELVAGGKVAAPLEVSRIPPEEVLAYSVLLKRLPELHPHASAYGWMNGDICPTPDFIKAANTFMAADCPEGKDVESQWRFVSGNRYNVDANMDDIDLSTQAAFIVASTSPRKAYGAGGVDVFVWNRAMYMDHLLPMIPDFVLPLVAADNFLMKDAHCNALVLVAEFGWSPDAIVLHLEHKPKNGVPARKNAHSLRKGGQKNFELYPEVDNSMWKRRKCEWRPVPAANDCTYNIDTKSFDCQKDVGKCTLPDETALGQITS